MNFTPAPPNDFSEFIETYFERCRERVPQIKGNAGKWKFEDLIPDLSDFDTRFLVSDAMTTDDWCRMSEAVGQVHLELAREHKDWARNLEHLPGVNLKWGELLDPQSYFTEFSQWSFHHGDAARLEQANRAIASHQWNARDERYHWGKIAVYYGPYNRSIDPPINLGAYENKYPLHSRLMHYLAPPLHSAVCLMQKETRPGKLEAMQQAREIFPQRETIELALDLIERHYEAPEYLHEPGVSELDERLNAYLKGVVNTLLENGAIIECPRDATPAQLKAAISQRRDDSENSSMAKLFENVKFSRLMKGRLWFYGQDVLWFDSQWLIRNELNRMRANFYETPLRLFARVVYGLEADADEVIKRMEGEVWDQSQAKAVHRFAELAGEPCADAELKTRALQIAAIFDPFLHALEAMINYARSEQSRVVSIA